MFRALFAEDPGLALQVAAIGSCCGALYAVLRHSGLRFVICVIVLAASLILLYGFVFGRPLVQYIVPYETASRIQTEDSELYREFLKERALDLRRIPWRAMTFGISIEALWVLIYEVWRYTRWRKQLSQPRQHSQILEKRR